MIKSKYENAIPLLRLMDDTLFNAAMDGQVDCAQELLRVILKKPDLTVIEVTTQKFVMDHHSRSVRLDILAEDSKGNLYVIEMQRAKAGANPHHPRYIQAKVNQFMLEPGREYKELKDSYVIFITEDDYFGLGEPVYTFQYYDVENEIPLDDGSYILYVNGSYEGDDEMGLLMGDLREPDPNKIHNKILRERVHYLKTEEEGTAEMCKIMDELVEEAKQEVAKEKDEQIERIVKEKDKQIFQLTEQVQQLMQLVQQLLQQLGDSAQGDNVQKLSSR